MDFTPDAQAKFLDLLRDTLNVSASARGVGVAKRTVYKHREANPIFKEAWDDAIEEGIDAAEQSVNTRAFKGVRKPVYQGGMKVGEVTEYSDSLAQFMLKAHRPAKFDKPTKIEGSINVAIADRILAGRKRAGI